MAMETDSADYTSLFERARLVLPLPFVLGFANRETQENPDEESSQDSSPRDRIIIINPLSGAAVVVEGEGINSLLDGLRSKEGQPPASKKAIAAMPRVKMGGDDVEEKGECVICLEEWLEGDTAAEMPCKHRFHEKCIERWLGSHATCPVCRYKMPVDEDDEGKKRREEREVWVRFSFDGSGRREDQERRGDQLSASDAAAATAVVDDEAREN